MFDHLRRLARSWAGRLGRRSAGPGVEKRCYRAARARTLRVESLESRQLLTTTVSLNTDSNVVIADAAATNNDLTITYAGSGNYTISDNGDTVSSSVSGSVQNSSNSVTVPVGSANSIIVSFTDGTDKVLIEVATAFPTTNAVVYNAGSGSNAMSVSLASGLTIPAGGITLNGNSAATANAVEIRGNGQSVTDTASGTTASAGVLADGTGTITFSAVTGIDLDGLATVTFKTSASNATVQVIDGTDFTHSGANAAIRVQPGDTTGTQFSPLAAWNDTDLTIDTTSNPGNSTDGALGAVTVDSADGAADSVTNLTVTTGGAVDTITLGGAADFSGKVTLTASASSISETSTAGIITAGTLQTQSATGTLLNSANVVSSFTAANSTSGDIQLKNTAAPLTISSISQSGGNVQVINNGGISLAGAISDANGIVSLYDTSAAINETTSGAIAASLLVGQAATGMTLNGANSLASFYARNSTSGDTQLNNTVAVTIIFVSQSGGNFKVVNAGGILVTGTVAVASGRVTLDDTSATVQEEGTGTITASALVTQSVTGTLLNSANAVASFTAANSGSGDLQLNNATALTIESISDTGGVVQVINSGGMTLSGAIENSSGNVSLDETSAAIQESGAGAIAASLLVSQSITGVTLSGSNSIGEFYGVNSTSGDVQLNNSLALTIAFLSETGGNIQISNVGGIIVPGTITDTSGTVTLDEASAAIQEYGSGTITASTLDTRSATGTLLNSANAVGSFTATNSSSGDVQLNNTTALTVVSLSETGGIVQIINAGGITLPGSVQNTGRSISLDETSGAITQPSSGSIDANLLVAQSVAGTTLNGTNTITQYVPITIGS
jgi:hypothetical protein